MKTNSYTEDELVSLLKSKDIKAFDALYNSYSSALFGIEDYISSGIIESYVLGQLSNSEMAEVTAMALQYPELKTHIELSENTLLKYAAKNPPPALKEKILAKIDIKETSIISIDKQKNTSILWLVAASFTLLIASAIYNIILMDKLRDSDDQLSVLSSEKEKYVKDFEAQSKSYGEMAQEMAVLMNPDNKKIMLKGMEIAPKALAAIYWNQTTEDVYINVNYLPMPAKDKQYQLWAIIDGKPIDAGMMDMEAPGAIHKMKSISGAQAFAVTLEKKGGSLNPTMSAMYLMGSV